MFQINAKYNLVTKLQGILKLKITGMYSEALKEIANILEQVLKEYYRRIFPFTNSSNLKKLLFT